MGKKRRNKNNNQQKQEHARDDHNPGNSSRDLDIADFISSLHNDILCQIIPLLLHKWNHQEKEHVPDNVIDNNMDPNDFISRLPKDILHKIISFLPFESAVRTSILSTQWKDLWKDALLFPVRNRTMEDSVSAIPSFLEDFDILHRPRNKWGFKFEFDHGSTLLVAILPKNTLRLDFSAGKQEFPRPFDWLLRLKYPSLPTNWFGGQIPEEDHPLHTQQPIYYWLSQEEDHDPLHTHQPSLNTIEVKSLYLISVSNLSNEVVSSMVSNLSLLESLTIAKCYGLRSLQIKEARKLRKLVVLDCRQLRSLCFEGSGLNSFQYRGRLVSFEFEVSTNDEHDDHYSNFWFWPQSGNKFSLKDAMLDLRQGPSIKYDGINSILKRIEGVKSLTLCRWVFEAFWDSEVRFYWLRELWWIDSSMKIDNVNALLTFLKLCPHLKRLYVTIDPMSYNMRSTKKLSIRANELEKLQIDPMSYNMRSTRKLSIRAKEHEKLTHLKFLKLEGFANENKEIFFVKQLSPLFKNWMRPLILAKSNGACLRSLVKVTDLGTEGKYAYKYKFKEIKKSYPDHVHMKII